jgi:hypothetical protein
MGKCIYIDGIEGRTADGTLRKYVCPFYHNYRSLDFDILSNACKERICDNDGEISGDDIAGSGGKSQRCYLAVKIEEEMRKGRNKRK